jgi:hypothetical protein
VPCLYQPSILEEFLRISQFCNPINASGLII